MKLLLLATMMALMITPAYAGGYGNGDGGDGGSGGTGGDGGDGGNGGTGGDGGGSGGISGPSGGGTHFGLSCWPWELLDTLRCPEEVYIPLEPLMSVEREKLRRMQEKVPGVTNEKELMERLRK